jgi:hypothetical protein
MKSIANIGSLMLEIAKEMEEEEEKAPESS